MIVIGICHTVAQSKQQGLLEVPFLNHPWQMFYMQGHLVVVSKYCVPTSKTKPFNYSRTFWKDWQEGSVTQELSRGHQEMIKRGSYVYQLLNPLAHLHWLLPPQKSNPWLIPTLKPSHQRLVVGTCHNFHRNGPLGRIHYDKVPKTSHHHMNHLALQMQCSFDMQICTSQICNPCTGIKQCASIHHENEWHGSISLE